MTQEKLNEILQKHQKWLNGEEGGERADLRGTDLRGTDFEGADIDYACWPIWCGSLRVHICDRIAKQLLYHVVSTIRCSKHVSVRMKQVVLTRDIIDLANEFHQAEKNGKIEYWSKEDAVI